MTIKELEQRTGLPRTAIRFYEQQGLIRPERRENNYRNYTQEDLSTLEKIKLLRQLSLDLESIQALKEGQRPLSQVLAEQADMLEGDRRDLERYAQVCRELSRAQVSFDTLEPQPWLEELSQSALPPSRRVDPAREDALRGPHPWRRLLARQLDVSLLTVVWLVLQFQVLGWYLPPSYLENRLQMLLTGCMAWLILLFLEPILLCTWGYTPGKWLLGVQVRQPDGKKLSWTQATERIFLLFWRGQGLNIPAYSFWRNWSSYVDCTEGKPLAWEQESRCTVRPLAGHRWALWAGCTALLCVGMGLSLWDSYIPPHTQQRLTPTQVVENYNFFQRRFSTNAPLSALNADGSWKITPAVYQGHGDWKELEDPERSEWSSLSFETADDGTVSAITVEFSPKGDPYVDYLDVEWVLPETMVPLMMATDPSGVSQDPAQQSQSRQTFRHLCRALLQVPFQGAGAENQVQGPGGMALSMAVTECRGCSASPDGGDYTLLLQEEPGMGRLSMTLTVTLP